MILCISSTLAAHGRSHDLGFVACWSPILQFLPGLCSSLFLQALYGFLQGLALSGSHAQKNTKSSTFRLNGEGGHDAWDARDGKAYDEATQHFCGAEFPPLRFQACPSLGSIQRYASCYLDTNTWHPSSMTFKYIYSF